MVNFDLAQSIRGPWILAGDFNSITDGSKRFGGVTNVRARCPLFRDFLFSSSLRDLGASGAEFTWYRGGLSQ